MPPEDKKSKDPDSDGLVPIKVPFIGAEILVNRFAVWGISVLVVVGFGLWLWTKIGPDLIHDETKMEISKSDFQQIQESQKHFMEAPTTKQTLASSVTTGQLEVAFFESDGCVFISRKLGTKKVDRWVLDPSRMPEGTFEPAPDAPNVTEGHGEPSGGIFSDPAYAAGTNGCSGTCLNPHPGQFRWWTGEVNGCWTQVWREWPEGCRHFQYFNTCGGYWDTWPDGTPKVQWICCVH